MTQQTGVAVGTGIIQHGPPVIADTEPPGLELLTEILLYELTGLDASSRPPSGSPTNLGELHAGGLGELLHLEFNLGESHARALRELFYLEFSRPFVLSVPMMIPDVWVDTGSSRTVVYSVVDNLQLLSRPSGHEATILGRRFLHSIGTVSAALAAGVSAEAATDPDSRVETRRADLVSYLETVFADAAEEIFEAGFESDFSRKLRAVVMACGDQAIDALAELMRADGTDIDAKAEALHQLGLIADRFSHRSRLEMLIRYLASPDARLRDSASVALAALDDPDAIQAVRRAVAQEPSPALRRDLQLVLDQLEETQTCSSSG